MYLAEHMGCAHSIPIAKAVAGKSCQIRQVIMNAGIVKPVALFYYVGRQIALVHSDKYIVITALGTDTDIVEAQLVKIPKFFVRFAADVRNTRKASDCRVSIM